MPKTYSAAERKKAIGKVLVGLREGTPLTIICSEAGMPNDDTIRDWANDIADLGRNIARARETGFDVIALEALRIADTQEAGEIVTVDGEKTTTRKEDMLGHRKLQVDTRLKLLAKWDPKRYGDRQLIGSDPDNPLPQGFTVNLVKGPASEPEAG